MQPKRILLASIVIALCIAPLFFLLGHTKILEAPTPPIERTPAADVSEEIASEEPAPKALPVEASAPVYTHTFVADTAGTLESIMQAKRTEGSLTYTSRLYPTLGSFVESIGGLTNTGGSYWMLYINGTLSSSGMSQAQVERGDRIEWRYE